ncbi:PREDICTED: uncharacterized protein LOC104804286 [Tarenaya hassleriana]|uniref:uncharacterized protein LOC104804286 n=1 Tax=Tarenaya hassleriana TaxID=28532 RepID=UPI00053C46E5|nr:PREDICTED: uncharacterized protein LOC104804286 [Tarenaya hassleriana]
MPQSKNKQKMAIKNHVRSISFPSRSHPSTLAIEEGLNELSAMEISTSSSRSICASLSGLEELYKCTDDLLNMGSTQRVLSERRKFLEELLDGSLRLMDICSVSRDLMVETGENVRALQSGVRRRRGGNDHGVVSSYVGFRKNMRKQARKLLVSLKQIENIAGRVITDEEDDHLVAVVHVMRRVVSVSASILNSFLEFLSGSKKNKWSLVVMKMLQKDGEETDKIKKREENELESLDSVVSRGEYSREVLGKKLEELEISVGGFEKNLENLFRRLIRTRASLLNVTSQ